MKQLSSRLALALIALSGISAQSFAGVDLRIDEIHSTSVPTVIRLKIRNAGSTASSANQVMSNVYTSAGDGISMRLTAVPSIPAFSYRYVYVAHSQAVFTNCNQIYARADPWSVQLETNETNNSRWVYDSSCIN